MLGNARRAHLRHALRHAARASAGENGRRFHTCALAGPLGLLFLLLDDLLLDFFVVDVLGQLRVER